ncbi:MAG: TetR/AcrR family transcriptional regulator [Clostridiales bacterium]|nr:TetR/AcrR family transcriptional regulator [Clostridiales bacterium]
MDQRQKKTRKAIFIAFTRLLENKTYSSLTVQDIIDEADIGRSTFYAHFETKDDLLREMCTDIFNHVFSEEIMSEAHHDFSDRNSFRDHITHILYHLKEEQQSIRGIFSGECGDIFLRFFREYLYHVFDSRLTDTGNVPREYLLNHAVSSFAETVRWWLNDHSGYSPEDISRFYFESVQI